jgi:AcrR family transcriptional regulator
MRKPRGRYHHGDLAQAALAAARREIDAHGHEGFTLERVAKRLGVGPSALYRHYKNRDALLRAVMWETFLRFVAAVDAAVLKETDPRAVLLALARSYTAFALENPGWFRLQFSRAGIAMKLKHGDAAPKYPDAVFAALRALLGDDQATLDAWYVSVWSLAHGVAGLTLERVLPFVATDAQRLAEAERVLRTVIGSLPQARAKKRRG